MGGLIGLALVLQDYTAALAEGEHVLDWRGDFVCVHVEQYTFLSKLMAEQCLAWPA